MSTMTAGDVVREAVRARIAVAEAWDGAVRQRRAQWLTAQRNTNSLGLYLPFMLVGMASTGPLYVVSADLSHLELSPAPIVDAEASVHHLAPSWRGFAVLTLPYRLSDTESVAAMGWLYEKELFGDDLFFAFQLTSCPERPVVVSLKDAGTSPDLFRDGAPSALLRSLGPALLRQLTMLPIAAEVPDARTLRKAERAGAPIREVFVVSSDGCQRSNVSSVPALGSAAPGDDLG